MLSESLTLYKLMTLYMLKQVKFPLKGSQISEFFLDKEYTTYFTLQQALNELLEAHLISQETIRNSSRYELTREGDEALEYFGNEISDAIKEDINQFLKENKIRLRNEVGVVSDYYRSTNSDIIVRCEIREGKSTLLSLNLSVPTEEIAETVCDNWQEDNQQVYAFIVQELMKSRK